MVRQENQNHQLFYICEECNFTYKEKHWAEKCETYCKEHKSCSLDITKHAAKTKQIKKLGAAPKRMAGFIQLEKYKEILDLIPIPCVDIVARHNNQFLMIKRKSPPAEGQWWLPGGRIFKGETMQEAAERKLKEETNLTGAIVKMLGPYETIFPDAPFDIKTGVHSINVVFLMDVKDVTQLTHDKDHADQQFFSKIEPNWHPYLKQVLNDVGFAQSKPL